MAENQTVTEDSQQHRHPRGTSSAAGGNPKGQSAASSGTGSMTSSGGIASKPNSLKHVGNLTSSSIGHHPQKAASMISPESKHHHHHHHHHHHSHSHSHHSTPHVIHRTTSESLRLGGTDLNVASGATSNTGASSPSTNSSSSGTTNCNSSTPQLHLSAPGMRKPKTSSFQITSVTVGNKLSADNGEDSADDLDESHTDDNSRITDLENETPSVSEDTFSKEDVFFSSNALGTAPVIPTSSQYGLVIVDPDLGGVGGTPGQTLSNVHVSVTDAGINIVGPNGGKLNDADQKDLQHRNERFKVVKIESTEPFKRGRWMCMDYLDHTTLQQTQSPNAESGSPPSTGTGNVATNDSGVAISENHVDSGGDAPESTVQPNFHAQSASPGQTLQNPISMPASTTGSEQSPLSQPATNPTGSVPTVIQAQTMGHVPNAPNVGIQQQQPQQNITAQSLPPTQLQQAISAQVPSQPTATTTPQTVPEYAANPVSNSNLQGQSQPANFYMNNQQPPTSAPSNHPHGATLPTNIQMQNGVPTNLPCSTQPPPPQPQQQAQPQQPQQPPQQPPASQPQAIPSVPMAVPSSILPSEQASMSASSSVSQTMVPPPVQGQQPAGGIIQTQQGQTMTTPHSAPQSQVSSDMYIPQSTPQSYAVPPVTPATIPTVSSSTSIAQDVPVDVPSSIPSAQPTTVISPAGGGGTPAGIVPAPAPTAEGAAPSPQQQQAQQQPPQQPPQQQPQPAPPASTTTPGIPNVMQDTAAASQPSTISDPAVIAAAIQAQQQVTAPPATLQTQQSVVASDETAQPAVDTDSESVSSLALALSSNKRSVANRCTAASTISAQPSRTCSSSKNAAGLKLPTGAKLKQKPKSSIFTNLALGQCIQKLMGVSLRESSLNFGKGKETLCEETEKSSTDEKPQGIPIPKSPRADNPNFFDAPNEAEICGPSSSSSTYLQIASSAGESVENPCSLRAIGRTNSIPVGCYTYKTDSGIGNTSAMNATTQPGHRRAGSVSAGFENSASGTSAVAIDNKIEQAMDLVKSHLMIAVREEVEVLKEKIAELMDRINQLELENTILKANVSQETLSQLSQTMQTTSTKAPQNTNTSNGPVS